VHDRKPCKLHFEGWWARRVFGHFGLSGGLAIPVSIAAYEKERKSAQSTYLAIGNDDDVDDFITHTRPFYGPLSGTIPG